MTHWTDKDVEDLVEIVKGVADQLASRGSFVEEVALRDAVYPFRNPKPQKVVPEYCGSFHDTSDSELHRILIALEAKIDALAEKVK